MPTDTQQTPQQVLVVSDNPNGVTARIHASGHSGELVFPALDDVAHDFGARLALRCRMASHSGPVIIDQDLTVISPAFLAFCVPTANILPV